MTGEVSCWVVVVIGRYQIQRVDERVGVRQRDVVKIHQVAFNHHTAQSKSRLVPRLNGFSVPSPGLALFLLLHDVNEPSYFTGHLPMHARELADIASWAAFNASQLVQDQESKAAVAAQRYWTSSKCRMQRWMRALKIFEDDVRYSHPDHDPWPAVRIVVEEILVSEVLARVWVAMMSNRNYFHAFEEMEAVAQNVYTSQIEARNRALHLILSAEEGGVGALASTNQLRRKLERWTDLLLGQLPDSQVAVRFAFDARRMVDFAEERQERSDSEGVHRTSLYIQGFQNDLLGATDRCAANPMINRDIASGIIGCFEADRFDSAGLPKAARSLWIDKHGSEAQLLVDQLVRLDIEAASGVV